MAPSRDAPRDAPPRTLDHVLITFDPVLLTVGPLAVRWFGLLALVGLGAAIWGGLRALERQAIPRGPALDALAWALPAGLIGARLVHVLGWWDYYLTHTSELWQLNVDGLSLWGGLLAGGLVGVARLGSTVEPRQRRRMLDAVVPSCLLGIALGRLGAFLDGHGQGLPSSLAWATQYANPLAATPDFGVSRHPAQAYDALVALGLWLVLSRLPVGWPAGSRAASGLVAYSLARLGLGAVRLDPSFLFGLQIEQLLALGSLGLGLVYGLRPLLGSRQRQAAGEARQPAGTDAPGPREVEPERAAVKARLYSKPGCHLCELAASDLEGLRTRYPHTLEVVDISGDDDLGRRYRERIPVLEVGGREYDAPLVPAVLQRALADATSGMAPGPRIDQTVTLSNAAQQQR